MARDGSSPHTSNYAISLVLSRAGAELVRMETTGDLSGLPELIEELTGLHESLPPGDAERGELARSLAEGHRARARHQQDPDGHRLAARYFD
ncbi:hypothetical protein [Streptomyces sp. NPDC059455]|uniref:hypothetical protein n=1 Tax=Streptomyces sp. NPDC059455 TaxID=3346837 RepID=UPI0036BCFF68